VFARVCAQARTRVHKTHTRTNVGVPVYAPKKKHKRSHVGAGVFTEKTKGCSERLFKSQTTGINPPWFIS
jgi:hypothetical protein